MGNQKLRRILSGLSTAALMAAALPLGSVIAEEGMTMQTANLGWDEIQSILSQYNAQWTEPTYEGLITNRVPHTALLGNGDVGIASGGDAYSKNFYISKSDFWGYGDGPKAIGGVMIQPAGEVQRGQTSLAQGKPATASSHHPDFKPDRAVSGDWQSGYEGWVSDVGNPQYLEIDLEQETTFDRIVIRHDSAARSGQEANNTMAFSVQVRSDTTDDWETVFEIADNHEAITDVTLDGAVTARYVRLYVEKGTQETTTDSQQNPRARIGQFELYNTALGGEGSADTGDFCETQDILNARILTDMQLDGVPVSMETKMMEGDNLLVTSIVSEGDADVELTVRLWAKNDNSALKWTAQAEQERIAVTRSIPKANASDPQSFTTTAALSAQVVGADVTEAKADNTAGTADLVFTLPAGKTVYVVTAVGGGGQTYNYQNELQGQDPVAQARALLEKASTQEQLQSLSDAHAAWWKDYWMSSAVYLDERDERLQTIQKYYYAAQYELGCTVREGKVAAGLYGIWHTTDNPSWRSDYHLNYNFISTFYGSATANRVEQLLPAVEAITDYLESGKADAATIQRFATEKGNEAVEAFVQSKIDDGSIDAQEGIPGAVLYPVGIGPWGMKLDPSYHNQTLNAAFSAYPLIQYYEYTQDESFLKDVLYEYLKPVLTFLEAWVVENEDGGYDIYAGYNEGSWALNSAVELACYKNCLRYAILASEKLGVDADKRADWQRLLDGLAEQPTATYNGKTIYSLAEKEYKDGEWVEMASPVPGDGNALTLESIIPGEVLGYYATDEELQILQNTVEAFIDRNAWGSINNFPKIFATAVNVRYDVDTVIDQFVRVIEQQMQANLTIDDNVHGIEKAGATEAVHNMLLLSDQGVVKVFPNWLSGRSASFTQLREKGAFLLSAAYDGDRQEVTYVDITSQAGGDITIASPWADAIVTDDNGNVISTTVGTAPNHPEEITYTFATQEGMTYHLSKGPKAQVVDKTALQRQVDRAQSGALSQDVFTQTSWETYREAVNAAQAVLENADATQGNVNTALETLKQAFGQLETLPVTVARFSAAEQTYAINNTASQKASLYTDWKTVDGGTPVDLTEYDPSRLYLRMDVSLSKEDTILSDGELFNGGMVKLRSVDDGGENNLGWGLGGRGLACGDNFLSFCLADSPDSTTGTIDWKQVDRLNMYIDSVNSKEGRFTMTLSNVVIVDTTISEQKRELLDLWYTDIDKAGFTPESVADYEAAMQQAQTAINDASASIDEVTSAIDALTRALDSLVPVIPPVIPGDVDGSGAVTAADALMALQAATGKIELDGDGIQAADVDGKAGITSSDALLILQYATKKIDRFPSAG